MKNRSMVNSILLIMIALILLALLSIGYAWLIGEYKNFKVESELTKKELVDKEREILQNEVNKVIEYLSLRKSQTERRLKINVKNRTYEAYAIALNIYNENKNSGLTKKEIGKMIKDALRPIRFNRGSGYYFIVDLNGIEQLYPIHPEFEGENLINLQDHKGNYVVQDEIKLVNKSNEGYIEGFWRKPETNSNKIFKKISFIKKIEPLGWYIGNGEYVDDVEKNIQREVGEYLSAIRYGSNGNQYIFVTEYTGVEKINGVFPNLVGQNLWDMEDATGRKIVQDGITMARENKEGGFITQYWYDVEGIGTSEKLSFMKRFDEWEWIIGTGVYLDKINQKILDNEKNLKEKIKLRIAYISLILVTLAITSLVIVRILGVKLNENLNLFVDFFKNASNDYEEMSLDKITYSEFQELAQSANIMIRERKALDEEIREINENLQKIVNDRESKLKNINNNIERLINIKSKKLIDISRRDSLTKLFNRRHILEKLNEEIRHAKENKHSLAIIMLDLDHFKRINDTYGHTIGDKVLEKAGRCIKANIMKLDIAGRYGGEEFLIILPETNLEEAYRRSEKIRNAIEDLDLGERDMKITASIGVAELIRENLNQLIDKADELLYQAKKNGRNRTEM